MHHKQAHVLKPLMTGTKKIRHEAKDTLHSGCSRFCDVCGDEPYYFLYKTIQNAITNIENDNLKANDFDREINNAKIEVLKKVLGMGKRS